MAGALAVGFGSFPETLKVEEAANFVFDRWLQDRGGKKNVEEEVIIQHVRGYLIQYQDRFKKVSKNTADERLSTSPEQLVIQNSLGYVNVCEEQTVCHPQSLSMKKYAKATAAA